MTIKPELAGVKTCIFGIQGSGKTQLARKIVKSFKRPAVYRATADFDGDDVFSIEPGDRQKDLDAFCKFVVEKREFDCVVFDEADQLFRNYQAFGSWTLRLLAEHRHIGVAVILIARRPQDIPPYITESSHNLFIFYLEGTNAVSRLNDLYPGLGDMASRLNYQKHDYIFKRIGHPPQKMNPVKI